MIQRSNKLPKKVPKLHTGDIEIAIAREFNYRQNLVVPNVFWGLGFNYEIDVLIITKSGYMSEVEIKVSKSDLKADLKKRHQHDSPRIKNLWFAVPDYLKEAALELIPARAGLLIVKKCSWDSGRYEIRRERYPVANKTAPKVTDRQYAKLCRLAAMRIWTLKENLYSSKRKWEVSANSQKVSK